MMVKHGTAFELTGDAIRSRRLAKRLTQRALAARAGFHANTIIRLEGYGADRLPASSSVSIEAVAKALGLQGPQMCDLPARPRPRVEDLPPAAAVVRPTTAAKVAGKPEGRAPSAPAAKSPKPVCGARNRRGLPCQRKELFKSGRCRNHGGLSTGARTPEGKAAQAAAARARAEARRMARDGQGDNSGLLEEGQPRRGPPAG